MRRTESLKDIREIRPGLEKIGRECLLFASVAAVLCVPGWRDSGGEV